MITETTSLHRSTEQTRGNEVLIRRKNSLYALVSVGREELTLSPKQQRQVNEFAESLRRSWEQVKQMESGAIPAKSAMDFYQ